MSLTSRCLPLDDSIAKVIIARLLFTVLSFLLHNRISRGVNDRGDADGAQGALTQG